jgi:tetratricopeptide (TPR) repeat protein
LITNNISRRSYLRAKAILVLALQLVAVSQSVFSQQTAEDFLTKGIGLAEQGKYDEAIKAFDEAIRLNPSDAMAWNNKGLALYAQGKYDEAIKSYDEVIRLKPDYAEAWYNKGLALQALGRNTEAEAAFAKARELGLPGQSG